MKLFEKIQHLVNKTPKVKPEIFLSLILDESYIQAAAWILEEGKKSHILTSTCERAPNPSWEDRIRMTDHAIGKLEEEIGSTTKISKVVFGLGERFVTKDGDIEKSVRPFLKQLTKSLGLKPLGFVPLSTSIAHFMRKAEGIPASVILIGITEEYFDTTIYRVGRLSFSVSEKRTESEGDDIENALKACTDADVLPSRIVLYGADDVRIQEVKSVLLRHQWTARANFLHYPKIETYPFDTLIATVVEAGANEITHELIEDISADASPSGRVPEEEIKTVEGEELEKKEKKGTLKEEPELIQKEEDKGLSHMVVVQPETLGFHETGEETPLKSLHEVRGIPQDIKTKKEEEAENPLEFAEEKFSGGFPFKRATAEKIIDEEYKEEGSYGRTSGVSFHVPASRTIGKLYYFAKQAARKMPIGVVGIGIVLLFVIGGGVWAATQYLPRATITLAVLPETLTREDTVIIDPEVTGIDTKMKIIPGKKLEKVVSGEKTIATSGKKKVGDPAKGTVTIFNKSEKAAYTLKKGAVLMTGDLQFTLDADVTVASASTNLSQGQTVFGKATSSVTAYAVGVEGNIEANKEFTFKEYGSSALVGRNEQPFTGGSSKEVTVVSRADYDTLLKSLTADLVEKAKAELAQSVSGNDRMIDQTIKTTIKEKKYVEEIDQEAKELHGSLTMSVSAYTYSEDDVKSLLSGVIQQDVPLGYSINPTRTTVTIGDITIAKDGKMTSKALLTASAIPTIDQTAIKKTIAGKKLINVEKELKTIPGVASAEFVFKSAWRKDVLPTNSDHISVIVSVVE